MIPAELGSFLNHLRPSTVFAVVAGHSVPPAMGSFPQILIEQIGQPIIPNPIPLILLGIWLVGFVSLISRWCARWARIRSILRGAGSQPAASRLVSTLGSRIRGDRTPAEN